MNPVFEACDNACDALESCALEVPSCEPGCTSIAGSCDQLHVEMLDCYAAAYDDECSFGPGAVGCTAGPHIDFMECRNALPIDMFCDQVGSQECFCGTADQQNNFYESHCFGDVCDCLENGQYLGTCLQDPFLTSACDPLGNCCTALSYITSPP